MGNAADVVRRIASYNVKLGEGGIREIEFLAQTLQLVWGGRDPTLRVRDTLSALRRLTANGRIDRATARGLSAAYRFSRTVEHRIQMVHDRQTHSIPTNQEDIRRLAIFLGYPDAKTFAAVLLAHAARVRLLSAQQTIEQDPYVQQLMRRYDAKIVQGSIQPL